MACSLTPAVFTWRSSDLWSTSCGMSVTKPIPTHEGLPSLADASNFPSGTRNEAVIIGEQSNWVYYNKPLTLIAIGLLVFLSGIGLSALHLVHAVDVPSALGPVCLSIGLMFFVMGMVWLPIIKHALRYDGLLTGSPTDSSA